MFVFCILWLSVIVGSYQPLGAFFKSTYQICTYVCMYVLKSLGSKENHFKAYPSNKLWL